MKSIPALVYPARAATAVRRRARRLPATCPRSPRGQVFGIGALSALVATSAIQLAVHHAEGLPAGAAFRIGGAVTSVAELDRREHLLEALYGVSRPTDRTAADQYDRQVAKAIAVSDILQDAAAKRGIVIADKAAGDQLDKVIQQSDPSGREDFVQKLGALGLSENDVLTEIKRQLSNAQLFDQVTKPAKQVTDQDVTAYYNAHKGQIATPEQRHLANIVVSTQAEASRILTEAKSGTDFATLAQRNSLDQSTTGNGGDLGILTADKLDAGYAKAAFAAPVKGFFGPVQTQYGWNVGEVIAVQAGQPLTLGQARSALKTQLQDAADLDVWKSWLTGQITAAHVLYAPAYRPAHPDEAPAGTASSLP